ncbi:hypothetical protein ERJ75_000188500 [Trypanosoma vivax]|nr:hypothetical protein ERJ75_000188500 [Trypanosoma vivax]
MSIEDRGVVSQWEGEWPWLKRRVTAVREWASFLKPAFDVENHITTVQRCTSQADSFVAERAAAASEKLSAHQWIIPTVGIAVASAMTTAKSASYGTYRSLRNGAIVAVALTAFVFPREIIARTDEMLPFRVVDPLADTEKSASE